MAFGPRSLRGRLALLFAVGSGALLLLSAGFLYATLNTELQSAINAGLRARADDIEGDLRAGDIQIRQEEAFAEILDGTGRILDASSTIRAGRMVLTRPELARASTHQFFIDRAVAGLGPRSRLLAVPETIGSAHYVIVVGATREALVRARARLALALLVLGPVLIAALTAGGWIVAGAALRPVRRMAVEADAISLTEPGRRLREVEGDDEIAELGRTLNFMLDRIEATFAHEQAFVDDASHELRTPISILRAELELALLQPGDEASVERALRSALEEAERLGRLAEDLLVLARAGAGQLPLRVENIDVHALARDVAGRVAVQPGPTVEVTGPSVVIAGDRARLEQVLVNLVVNARRYSRGRIVIAVVDRPAGVDVVVADDGPGFAPELLDSVFHRFSRDGAARGRAAGGAGLGLAIVAALVKAHGGVVEAGNGAPLGGAVVTVSVPKARADARAPVSVRR